MSYLDVKNFRKRLKERSVYVLGDKCICCGYNKCIEALEFHHLNPELKSFSFNDNINRSWSDTETELQKCILVCANCHREIHYNIINTSNLCSSYNKERADEITLINKNINTHKDFYCQDCGKEISFGCIRCSSCLGKQHRVIVRPTREILKELIYNYSFVEIGKQFGVTDNAIKKWCKTEKLPSKRCDIKLYTPEEWLLI